MQKQADFYKLSTLKCFHGYDPLSQDRPAKETKEKNYGLVTL